MPRYFFDTDDDDLSVHDDDGQVLNGPEAARKAALAALPDMARDKIPDGDRRLFSASVRDENGAVIYTARLTLDGAWTRPT